MKSPLARLITLVKDSFSYEVTTNQLIVHWVYSLFLKSHTEYSNQDNPNWNQAMNGPFAYEYWRTVCNELETLEGMGACDVLDREYDMNII